MISRECMRVRLGMIDVFRKKYYIAGHRVRYIYRVVHKDDMKYLMTMLFALLALAPVKKLYAQGMASAMGEMSTIVLDGPFDVGRNPALLAQEERTGALGFTVIYQSYDSYRTTPDADLKSAFSTTIDREFIVYDPDTFLLIGGAAFFSRSDRFAFGMSFSQSYKDEKSESFLRVTLAPGPFTSRMYGEQSQLEKEVQSNMNLAYLVMPGLSIGMQYQFKYKTSSSTDDSKSYAWTTLDTAEKKEEDSKSYTSTLNFGVLYRMSSLQLGALVTAGDYTLKRSSYKNIKEDYDPVYTVDYNISAVTSLEGTYNGAPGMVLGCLYSLTQDFAIAAEAGFRIPLEYHESDLTPSTTGYVEDDVTTKNHFGYLFSAGIQYRVDANLKFACGGLVRYFSFKTEGESTAATSVQEVDYQLYSFRLGLEKKVFDDGYIVLFSSLDYGRFSIRSSEVWSGPGSISMKFDMSRSVLSLSAGISYIHYF
jgi:hypothetical protein